MNIDGVEAAFKKVAINANGRLKRGIRTAKMVFSILVVARKVRNTLYGAWRSGGITIGRTILNT